MNLQFLTKHPALSLQYALGIPKGVRFDAGVRNSLCAIDAQFHLHADQYYDETKPIVGYLREKLAAYDDGTGLGILEFHLVASLYCFVRAAKPQIVIETGTANGASTYAILKALSLNGNGGMLHSIDLPQAQFGATNNPGDLTQRRPKQTAWLAREGVSDFSHWQLHLGDSHNILPKLSAGLSPIDVFIHDSEHTYETMMFEFEAVWPHLKPGGFLLSDDLNCSNAFHDFCRTQQIPHIEIGRFDYAQKT